MQSHHPTQRVFSNPAGQTTIVGIRTNGFRFICSLFDSHLVKLVGTTIGGINFHQTTANPVTVCKNLFFELAQHEYHVYDFSFFQNNNLVRMA